MATKPKRRIVESFTYGDALYREGDESELAKSGIPQWNLDQIAAKGWISGDWKDAGLSPEEEAEAVAEAQSEASAPARSAKKRGSR